MFKLVFNADKLPRSMTREEWKELERWRRPLQRALRAAMLEQEAESRRRFENVLRYGHSHPELFG